ncbi:hypothetical protein LOC72_11195 [Roseiconus lacunae]|nr:hypothetical protein [Roseiconus lacunae]
MKIEPIRLNPESPVQSAVVVKPSRGGIAWPVAFVLGALIIAAGLYLRPSDRDPNPGPGPEPLPVENVAEVTADATRDYVAALADANRVLAEETQSGTLANRSQYMARSIQLAKAARKAAFMPLSKIEEAHLPSGEWSEGDRKRVVSHSLEVARGHDGVLN